VTIWKTPSEIANGIEYGLSSALYTKDVNKAFAAIRDLETGITLHQCAGRLALKFIFPSAAPRPPATDTRRRIGAIDFYTEWKSVYVDYSDTLQKAQIDRGE